MRGEPMSRTNFYANMLLLVLCLGPGASTVQAQAPDDAAALRMREQQLSGKVRMLRSEQQQLLLRKMLYSSDSKYLELDLRAGEGSLRYRARILRTFRFKRQGKNPKQLPEGGIFVMTAKDDGAPSKRRLSFRPEKGNPPVPDEGDAQSVPGGRESGEASDTFRAGSSNVVLVLEGTHARRGRVSCSGLCLTVGKKDLAAIFFTLETGSFAYVKLQ
jgi:hypothetical protein